MNDVERTQESSAMKRAGQAASDEAGHTVRDFREEAAEQARRTGERTRDGIKRSLENQKAKLVSRVGSVAHAVRQGSHTFREEEKPDMEAQSNALADRIEQLQRSLDEYSVDRAYEDVRRVTERRPVWLVGAAVAAAATAGAIYMGMRSGHRR